MPCCSSTILPFFNEASTTVSYGPSLQSQYGNAPKVSVVYWDGTNYVAQGIFTNIALMGYPVSSITVEHGGGLQTGLIKIG